MTPKPVPFRYRRLGYVALNVSDVARTSAFAEDIFGLDPAGEGPSGERFFRCSNNHHDVVLYQGEPGFKRVGWELESVANVERAFAHFEALGLSPHWVSKEEKEVLGLSLGPVFRVKEPHTGATFEYFAMMQQKAVPFKKRLANIQRIGHFAINVPDVKAATQYYVENLGFRVSDFVGDLYVSLMRIFPNPLHHSMGLGQSRTGAAHFNHMNFMVTDIDDIGRALYRFQKNNVPIQFGPGRHPTSDSIFIYVQDPDGLTWEYSFGMELFPEENPREPRFMSTKPEDFDVWGAMPVPGFASQGVIEK